MQRADGLSGWLAGCASRPNTGGCWCWGIPGRVQQQPGETDGQAGPRPPHWGSITHVSLVLPPTSLASFWNFLFLALPSPCDLKAWLLAGDQLTPAGRTVSFVSLETRVEF